MDPAGGMGANVRELESRLRAGGLDVTSLYYAGARRELLNETNRVRVTADVVSWLDGATAITRPRSARAGGGSPFPQNPRRRCQAAAPTRRTDHAGDNKRE